MAYSANTLTATAVSNHRVHTMKVPVVEFFLGELDYWYLNQQNDED
jgi:hypothetical protein